MRPSTAVASVGLAGVLFVLVGIVPARADVCFDLWVQRNSI